MTETFEQLLTAIRYYCNYAERCHYDVRSKLLLLGARGEELEELLSTMIAENLLNEERYASAFARGKFNINHWGRTKIKSELKKKQVSDYCISKGLKEIDENSYLQMAVKLGRQKYDELKAVKHLGVRKQKVIRYLIQKGFEYHIINDITKAL